MSDSYAGAILHCYKDICDNIRCDDIILELVSSIVVTIQEKQDLDALQVGTTTKCSRLLDLILDKKRDLELFTTVLQTKHPILAQHIKDERKKIESGERLPHIKVVEQQFKSFYKNSEFQLTEKLPGEDFTLDVSDESQLLPLYITVETADKEFLQKQRKRAAKHLKLHYRYKHVSNITSITESVFDDELLDGPNRLYICTGIAGVGKTVTVHRLAWQWANSQNKYLKRFSVLIVIPLSKVSCHQTLKEILSDDTGGLGYIKKSQQDTIPRVIEKQGQDVLFVIDGGDEVKIPPETELFKLINGQLLPEAKVFVMARSDIHSLAAIADFHPDVKIHINGTSQESISEYIEASLVSEQASENVIKEFKKLVHEVDILHIPLYLAMVSILFDHHWSSYGMGSFRVPKTATDVLNSFMSVIIKVWLQKNNRKNEMDFCTFQRCALEEGSKIPIDIRAKLVNMGRMSFECLLNQRYNFNDSDFERYLIEKNDIQSCGMFRQRKDTHKGFCFIHQIFQQYLSALYLSHMELKDAVFLEHIRRKQSHSQTMETLFSPLELCVKFIFGMCPALGSKLMEMVLPLATCCRQEKGSPEVTLLNVQFESELCRESGDSALVKIVEEFLLQSEACCERLDVQHMGQNFECVLNLLNQFSENTCISLLERIYNLKISKDEEGKCSVSNNITLCSASPERQVTSIIAEGLLSSKSTATAEEILEPEDGWCVLNKIQLQKEPSSSQKGLLHDDLFTNAQHVSLILDNLDVTCYSLLSKFVFPNIEKLVVLHSITLDVDKLMCIFPKLKTLKVRGSESVDTNMDEIHAITESVLEERSAISSLEHIDIHGDNAEAIVPACVTSSIFQNKNLKSLSLTKLQMFPMVEKSSINVPEMSHLSELILSDCRVNYYMHKLCDLIKYAQNLIKLHIHNTSGEMCDKSSAEMLMTTLLDCPLCIQHLALVHTFDIEGVHVMCSFVPKMQSLKQLSLGEWDLSEATDKVISVTQNVLLHIYIQDVTRKDIRKLLGTRKVKVSPLSLPSPNKPQYNECDPNID